MKYSQEVVQEIVSKMGIVPAVAITHESYAVPIAEALQTGGIPIIEVTFRTDAAEKSIQRIVDECPSILVGAGTILTVEQCKRAVDAGAAFIVSPGFDEKIVEHCISYHIPIFPGCATATDITKALSYGLHCVKLFPARQLGGPSVIKAFRGPFPDVLFLPTGGINEGNIGDYLELSAVCAVGGSWLTPKVTIEERNWSTITELAEEAVRIRKEVRG